MNFLPSRARPHLIPILLLCGLSLLYWGSVLFAGQVLLPGAMLRGFAPFGGDPTAPWNILQWDALAQYYPWRNFVAEQLRAGQIPLWNPHQFAGTPLLANAQSAVFYPLSLPFWLFDTAATFGISAFLHTLLASAATYFLAQRWHLSRGASLVAAVGFGFCGYLAAWVMLPTVSNTASWLPLLLLTFEKLLHNGESDERSQSDAAETTEVGEKPVPAVRPIPHRLAIFAFTLACALLAGHAQIFFYLLLVLFLRALCHGVGLLARVKNVGWLVAGTAWALMLGAAQILPTLELARLGHRAAQGGASAAGWADVHNSALQPMELLSLFLPDWPMRWGSINENFGYAGLAVAILGIIGLVSLRSQRHERLIFVLIITVFSLLYAMATPLAQAFYYGVPGVAQMGRTGRALLLWNFGVALLAGFGVDVVRAWLASAAPQARRYPVVASLALLIVAAELFFGGRSAQSTALRETIYPATPLTTWLQQRSAEGGRVLFLTPRRDWLPTEGFREGRTHPPGTLPPNGATVYGLNDVNGYDSLAPLRYRQFVNAGEGADTSPPLNGNMILLENLQSPALDALDVRWVVSGQPLAAPGLREVWSGPEGTIYQRTVAPNVKRVSGSDFYPGWKDGKYQPETFRCGLFLSLVALAACAMVLMANYPSGNRAVNSR